MTNDNNNEFEYDVALSFAGEDRTVVEKFAKLLKAKNIEVFYDEYEAANLWGRDLVAHLADIYGKKARYCVMFISQYYPLKKWTKLERMHAQDRALRDANEYILPIRLDDTEVPGITETTGYRDLRQHPMGSIVNLLEQKLAKAKGRTISSSISPSIQSASEESIYPSFGSIPMPKRNKTFTQLQKDRFAKESFDLIKEYFQRALKQLEAHDPNIQTDYNEVNNLDFTGKIYVQEAVKCQCRIWLGEPNTIFYNGEIRSWAPGNSYNDYLTVEDNGEELRWRISPMGTGIIHGDEQLVNKEKAAEHLWKQLISRL
jgi:hypothetical protein